VYDPETAVGRRWTGAVGPELDAAAGRGWIEAGARLIGGCCRVGPDRIAGLAALARAGTA
jgi:homocysteine S-methyltransferase